MAKIPEDIIKAGRRCYDGLGRGSVSDSEHIARAILAERERCAKVVDEFAADYREHNSRFPNDRAQRWLAYIHGLFAFSIAAAIRKEPAE